MSTLSPVLSAMQTYPFVRLDEAKAAARARGVELIDFGMGDPIEPTPEFIQRALADALPATEGYPRAGGLPELRAAIAGWLTRRFGATVDPEAEIIPTYGSKEAIFLFPLAVCGGEKNEEDIAFEKAQPIRNHGLFSKAEKALTFAGWSEKARRDIEIFPLEDIEGLTPILMVLADDGSLATAEAEAAAAKGRSWWPFGGSAKSA